MKRVKICQITTVDMSLRFLLWNQLQIMMMDGFWITAVCAAGPWIKDIEQLGITVKTVPFKRSISPVSDLLAVAHMIFYLRRERPAIVHTHTPKAGLLGQLAAKIAGVPIIINTIHGFYFHENMPRMRRKFYIFCERIAALCSDLIFSQNRADMATAVRERICPAEKMTYLGNGVDLERFRPIRSRGWVRKKRVVLGIPPDAKVIGMVGRLTYEKGYRELFLAAQEILSMHREAFFVIVGPSDVVEEGEYQALVKDLGIAGRVRFMGMRLDMADMYSVMDIFVLPSHREGFPRSLIEASATGLPVVATDIRGCREVVDPGKTGLLIPLQDHKALAQAVRYLLGHPNLAGSMGRAGRERAVREFDERLIVKRQLDAYRQLLEKKQKIG
jgi:glycosyltransferase involved in cell wall biosynthesis